MTELPPGFADDDACLGARVGLVLLRLSAEVNRLRALRGDGREDRFAGVLMRDSDIAALCAELIAAPLPPNEDLEAALEAAETRYAARLAATPILPAFERVSRVFGMSAAEETIFATALAAALDPRIARVLGYLNEDMGQQHLTLGLAQRLVARQAGVSALWSALSEDGTLVRYGLLRVEGTVTASAALHVHETVQRVLLTGPGQAERQCQLPIRTGAPPDGPVLIEAATAMDALVALGPVGPAWLAESGRLDEVRALGLLAALNGQAVVLCGADDMGEPDRLRLMRGLGRHAVLVTKRPALWSGAGLPWRRLQAKAATQADRLAFWAPMAGGHAAHLAEDAQAPPGLLWRLSCEAPDPQALALSLRHTRSEPMQGLADRIRSRFTFDDLELPARQIARLRAFADRRKSDTTVLEAWGLGAALGADRGAMALFTGPSGVGKTMAASVVARGAGVDLWRINLATLVSKYIGETEKNLDRIFRAADETEVMLFFDEAEALFSKRAEVKEARDRYANMQMAYLLQRIEDFRGMAVLASNMGSTLDPAMLRRFDMVLEFQVPDAAARRRLWARIETGRVPLADDVDLDALAERFELAGGHIRQAILTAAHDAVGGGAVTQAHLLTAVAREYAKLSRPIRKEDFGAQFAKLRGVG